MTVNKIAICPICKKRTWLRITDGGYLKEYPVRVHCMNCRALIKGVYATTGAVTSPGKLTLVNAECVIDPTSDRCSGSDYVAEISGELPCKKVRVCDGNLKQDSVFLRTEPHIDMMRRIEQLKKFNTNLDEWKRTRSTAFQLLNEGGIEYIAVALGNRMGDYKYQCDHYLKSLHCLQYIVLTDTQNIFFEESQHECIRKMINHIAPIDREALHMLIERTGGIANLLSAYRKVVEVFSSFMSIYSNLLPAETLMQYRDKDIDDLGIATCSFTDIKTFYQDAYEALLPLMYIPICIDNIIQRNDYRVFHPRVFQGLQKRGGPYADDFEWFLSLDNGMKLSRIQNSEYLQSVVNLSGDRHLRNGIGHNNIKYDGLTQTITAYDLKDPSREYSFSLTQMATACLKIAKSAVILSEMILFLLRFEYGKEGIRSILPIERYENTGLYDLCPCGSNQKYKWCCKAGVDQVRGKISR